MCGIYCVINKINKKRYIGQSVNIEKRWRRHKRDYGNEKSSQYNSKFYRAIRKYGIENFSFLVLEKCSKSSLNEREIYWINFYNSYENGYNSTLGGTDTPTKLKFNQTELEQIKYFLSNTTLSQSEIGKKYNASQRAISSINLGQTYKQDNWKYPLRQENKTISNICPQCGGYKTSIALLCKSCNSKSLSNKFSSQLENKISRKELKNLIRIYPFSQIGKMYGVSDNAVRKWCKNYQLPYRKKDIKNYSDKDWEQI